MKTSNQLDHQLARRRGGRQVEQETLEAVELGGAEVLGEHIGGDEVGASPAEVDQRLPHSTTAAILCEWAVGAARRQPFSFPNT